MGVSAGMVDEGILVDDKGSREGVCGSFYCVMRTAEEGLNQ